MDDVRITVRGDVATPRGFTQAELLALPGQVEDVSQLVAGRRGGAVRLSSLLAAVGARGAFVTLCAADGFSISVRRALVEDGLLTYRMGEGPLPAEQGGPVRFLVAGAVACDTGEVDACANVKRLVAIEVTAEKAADTHRH